MAKKDIYQEITNQIISDLEQGTPVWKKPWEKSFTGFPIKRLFLELPLWLKKRQSLF